MRTSEYSSIFLQVYFRVVLLQTAGNSVVFMSQKLEKTENFV